MYLSRLYLNPRSALGAKALSDPYAVHREITKGFEDREAARMARPLFRVETDAVGRALVLVQTLIAPDWGRLSAEDRWLGSVDGPKHFNLAGLAEGKRLTFRLRARPSKRIAVEGKATGPRRSLREEAEQLAWIHDRSAGWGFRLESCQLREERFHDSKSGERLSNGQPKPLGAVTFDGVLLVTDPEKLRQAVANGIGPQKAFGFGLLSLAPLGSRE